MHAHDGTTRGGRGRGKGRGPREDFPGHWGGGWGGWGGGGRRRMRRGDIRRGVLSALQDGPAHGYEIMRRLEERSGGIWRPSPGSVYPLLQMLEDEGLVRAEARDGTRVFELTDAGRAEAEAAQQEGHVTPWAGGESADRARTLRSSMGQLFLAVRQLGAAGTPEQVDKTVEILQRAKKELYQLLAED
ncbi:MAG TPA: PadR family transcriptional regulator [Acidimicrobiales bacterium]|nr:PadR family transcriptional regulator [Acidimicrobiales bacterium]